MLLATATASVKEKRERDRERERQRELERERERESYYDAPSTTFLLADAKAMGIPVFANPIGPPKLVLGNFPKVTTSFAQFDNKPFRKEKPRDWEFAERSVTGIGGAVLKFKTWRPGAYMS
jgi:hypothetical protein